MSDKSVVRNTAHTKNEFSIRERHNERLNESYHNSDIQEDRHHQNVYFKQCVGSYAETFDAMLAAGVISLKGLKKDGSAKVFDEFVFDVNTDYFERHGGYEYAKSFYEEAYRCAINEIGGEQFVISAVMHADERNIDLSEKLGRDIYHYHLHVVYIPVVQKDCYFSKDNKNPELAGKFKETITQVSHSKKWPKEKQLDENGEVKRNAKGNAILINSYSLLQDRYHDHMKKAGFTGFERGERGSTAEHLETLEFKSKKEAERAAAFTAEAERKQGEVAALDVAIEGKEQAAAVLDQKAEKKQKQLDALEKKTAVVKQDTATVAEIENMVKPTLLSGNLQISPNDWKKVSGLAKEGLKSRGIIADLKKKVADFIKRITGLEKRLEGYDGNSVIDEMNYYRARQRAPRRMLDTIADIMRKPPEQQTQERAVLERKQSHAR